MTENLNPPARRILVVDDNRDSAETLADLLQMMGYDTRTAGDGAGALALLAQFTPALALLDIGLPDMDGYQLAGQIRRAPGPGAMKLVALTGWGGDEDRARATQAGFDGHLVKPVAIEQLLETIERLLALP